MKPEISIIIPAFNSESYLAAAVQSALSSSKPSREIVIIDDGSSDGTLDVARRVAASDSRAHVISQPPSGKPSIARNRGIQEARGELLCFLDADDLFHKDKLALQSAVFRKHEEIEFCFTDAHWMSMEGEVHPETHFWRAHMAFIDGARKYLQPVGDREYICKSGFYGYVSGHYMPIWTGAVMVRKVALEREGQWFPEDMTIGEDLDLWFRLLKRGHAALLDRPLSYYRQHPASITKERERYLIGAIIAYSRNYTRASPDMTDDQRNHARRRIGDLHFELGYFLYRAGRLADARASFLASLSWRPTRRAAVSVIKATFPQAVGLAVRRFLGRA